MTLQMTNRAVPILWILVGLIAFPECGWGEEKHLFILSGQSNMVGMDPEVSFTPAVTKAFDEDQVIVVKSANSGQSIRSWAKTNHENPPPTRGRVPKVRGELYVPMIKKVKAAIEGQSLKTVTFVWMQGESDLNNTAYDAYLKEVLTQLQTDLSFDDINVVIGRISDSGLDNPKRLKGRLTIRRVQQEFAELHPRGAWVDTDDLNDRKVDGKLIHDLHYTKEGYRILGARFAEKAIALIQAGAASDLDRYAKGLVATYSDGKTEVSEVVLLPELGLDEGESPHPAVGPAFTVTYEGLLKVTQTGTYRFDSDTMLWLDGKLVNDEVKLEAGWHTLRLKYGRPRKNPSIGFAWECEHFIGEPVPPSALWHLRKETASEEVKEGPFLSPSHRISKAFASMKCMSCHDGEFLATMHHKFAPGALLTHMRHANPMKWYGAMTGPRFEESELLAQLAADLAKLPQPKRTRGKARVNPGRGLEMIGAKGGMACVACHDIRHYRTAAESKGPNLAYIADRVSYDWFVRWMTDPQRLKPGVPMPAFFAGQSRDQQIESINALWDYLQQGEKMPLPEELKEDPKKFVLKPLGKPLVNRVYMRLPDGRELMRAICVGLPNGVSFCFDAETCRLVYVWAGGYLDMTPHWKNQSLHPIPAIGRTVVLPLAEEGLAMGEVKPRFRGYELIDGIPRFEFHYGETEVYLGIDAASADEIRQSFTIGSRSEALHFTGPSAESAFQASASQGKWEENRLTIKGGGKTELTITLKRKERR